MIEYQCKQKARAWVQAAAARLGSSWAVQQARALPAARRSQRALALEPGALRCRAPHGTLRCLMAKGLVELCTIQSRLCAHVVGLQNPCGPTSEWTGVTQHQRRLCSPASARNHGCAQQVCCGGPFVGVGPEKPPAHFSCVLQCVGCGASCFSARCAHPLSKPQAARQGIGWGSGMGRAASQFAKGGGAGAASAEPGLVAGARGRWGHALIPTGIWRGRHHRGGRQGRCGTLCTCAVRGGRQPHTTGGRMPATEQLQHQNSAAPEGGSSGSLGAGPHCAGGGGGGALGRVHMAQALQDAQAGVGGAIRAPPEVQNCGGTASGAGRA